MQLHLPLAFKQVVYIENTPTPEALELKLAVKSRFVCMLIFSTRQTRSDVGPWLGNKRDKSILGFYYTVASSMTTDPWTGSLWSTATRGIIKTQTKICNPHPGPSSGEARQPGMLSLGGEGAKSVFLGPCSWISKICKCRWIPLLCRIWKLKIRISLILIKNSPGFGLTNKSFYL